MFSAPIAALGSNVFVERIPGDALDIVRMLTQCEDTFAWSCQCWVYDDMV